MASVYLDTSALIKLYVEEEGTERIVAITHDFDGVQAIILDVTPLEARSAVRRRQREGDISGTDADRILDRIEGAGRVDGAEPELSLNDAALPLAKSEIETTLKAAALDWPEIDPSILGTLFERGLDPDKRSQLGAHYTDRDKIMRIVEPVVVRPWLAEWETVEDYVSHIFKVYAGRGPAEADLVCYWLVKAGEQIDAGWAKRVGLVSTNSIRGGANRRALQTAIKGRPIFEAWGDEPWVIDGAAVRVSLVCFAGSEDGSAPAPEPRLDGEVVDAVHSDLTARRGGAGVDLTGAQRLYRNMGVAFMGDTKGGPFDVPGEQAREWLREPANPNGRPNSDVLGPWMNGMDVTRRPADKWIVDFGWDMVREEAALYEAPFQHAKEHVYPMRQRNRRESYREHWWRHVEPRQGMWRALGGLSRYIATPRVAKHRLFTWLDARIRPDSLLIVIARDDDVTFGILHSRFHEAWSLRLGTSLEDRPRYTPTTTFETFPFPEGLSPDVPASDYADDPQAAAIAEAARRLVSLRNRWLNPPELVEWVDEPVPGYPRRPVARDEAAEKALKKRTLTNLYNARPQWLDDAHAAVDAAVAAAYGWPADISDDAALRALLAFNLENGGW